MSSSPSASAGLLAAWLASFACLFTRPTLVRVPVLVEGALLTLHRRTVSAALRAAGWDIVPGFARYHRVLAEPRSVCGWEPGALVGVGRRVLLGLLVGAFAPSGPVVIGVDDTLERRWARQALLQAARWMPPGRRVVAVTDGGYAALDLLAAVQHQICVVAWLRADARLFDPAPPRRPGTIGRRRLVGQRQPTLARRLADPHTRWRAITVAGWYGGSRLMTSMSGSCSASALSHRTGQAHARFRTFIQDVTWECGGGGPGSA